nr:MAG TPA: hypothetical protein [Caudoviricetes sp.]
MFGLLDKSFSYFGKLGPLTRASRWTSYPPRGRVSGSGSGQQISNNHGEERRTKLKKNRNERPRTPAPPREEARPCPGLIPRPYPGPLLLLGGCVVSLEIWHTLEYKEIALFYM